VIKLRQINYERYGNTTEAARLARLRLTSAKKMLRDVDQVKGHTLLEFL